MCIHTHIYMCPYFYFRYLINMGANVNCQNNINYSSLHMAGVRADEKFIHLLVNAGANLHQEAWIIYKQFPVALNSKEELKKYLLDLAKNPRSLFLCSINKLRRVLGSDIHNKVKELPLPSALKESVSLKGVI